MGAETASTAKAVPVPPSDGAGGASSAEAAAPISGPASVDQTRPGTAGDGTAPTAAAAAAAGATTAAEAQEAGSGPEIDAGTGTGAGADTATDLGALALQRDASLIGANTDPQSGLSRRLGWIGALAGHIAILAVIFASPAPQGYWSGGSDGDGIDVEIVGMRQPSDTDTSVARADQAESLARVTAPPPEPARVQGAPPEPADAPETDPDLTRPEPSPKPVAATEPASAPAPEPRPKTEPDRDVATPAADADPSKGARDRLASTPTGAQRLGVSSSVTLRASPGEISAYSRAITETLDRAKPRTTLGLRGTVSISFAIDDTGGIERAYVDRSSGSARLDSLALDALKAVRLPPPPQGLTAEQRVYRIPITFQ